jgi:uncharacterized protein YxjI
MGTLGNTGSGDDEQRADHRCFRMHQSLISIGDDYWIEDSNGRPSFKVDGSALRFRDNWVLHDTDGRQVATFREHVSLRDAIDVEVDGLSATVKKSILGFRDRDRFHVDVNGGENLKVHGNVVEHEYTIERDGQTIAEISKKWFRVRDCYGVEVRDPLDVPMALAVTMAVDALSHGVA